MSNATSARVMQAFRDTVQHYYALHGRDMPWRRDHSAYSVLVSEIMLQQTQVSRVNIKYAEFMTVFPDIQHLAQAPVAELLRVWKGLGYNRRALWLQRTAEIVQAEYAGVVPADRTQLVGLPGIGPNTAGAILAYAYNQPEIFIETNIRRVFLHHFFADAADVPDSQLLPYIALAIIGQDPRTWYWAVMDYGTHLAKVVENPNRRSKHYAKQSKFEGSHRQLRGRLLARALHSSFTSREIEQEETSFASDSIQQAIAELVSEGFLSRTGERLTMKTNDRIISD